MLVAEAAPQIVATSAGRGWRGLEADLLRIPRGVSHVPGGALHGIGVHFGPPVRAECQCGGLRVRRVQKTGDIDIVPAGLDGTKTLQDVFTDNKIPRDEREQIPVVECGGEIVWVDGLANGEQFRAAPDESEVLVLSARKYSR